MKVSDTARAVRALRRASRPFHYFEDRSALLVLALDVGERGRRVCDLKDSPLAGLLRRPAVRPVLAGLRGGVLRASDLLCAWPSHEQVRSFVPTFGAWGATTDWDRRYEQTSRAGLNIVVRLNFSNQHDRPFRRMLAPGVGWEPHRRWHPVDKTRFTLAWARIDIGADGREALIEEVQSDWVRDARELHRQVAGGVRRPEGEWRGAVREASPRDIRLYHDHVLAPYVGLWPEAILAAALVVLVRDLGVETIWYHTFETGCWLKGIDARRPPRSIYSRLPRRLGFLETSEFPQWLYDTTDGYGRYVLDRRKPRFHVLRFDREVIREVRDLVA